MKKGKRLNMNQIWLGFFGIWTLLLTGALGSWVNSPGLKQWHSVSEALSQRRQEIADVETESATLTHTAHQLEVNSVAQEREIRKVLGYLGEQELVFEFSSR
jgi:hypothetical protein